MTVPRFQVTLEAFLGCGMLIVTRRLFSEGADVTVSTDLSQLEFATFDIQLRPKFVNRAIEL